VSIVQSVHHISLKAQGEAQFQRAVAFYTDVLGARVVHTWGQGDGRAAMLDLGNVLLELTANGRGLQKGHFAHIAFRTADVDTAARAVEQAGFPVFLPPTDKDLGPDYPVRIAFCTGPTGEEIEFFQERARRLP